MADEKSKILMLVEGTKTDYRLMQHLLSVYGIGDNHEIISYNTNIYVLYNEVFCDGDPSAVDLLQSLKEHESDPHKKALLDQKYTDILLVFDLDPQDPSFSERKVLEMLSYFVESSDMGKLYLNYPMVESFYHMKSIPDDDYYSYEVSMDELINHTYKARVARENRNHDYRKFAFNRNECSVVIKQNIEKAFVVSGTPISSENVGRMLPKAIDVLKKQLSLLRQERKLSVLCTCVFYIADYNYKLLDT